MMNREELAERLGQIGGCGNAHCIVYEPPGQHTNGGCKCNRDPMRMTQTVWAYKQALASSIAREDALQAEVEALKRELQFALTFIENLANDDLDELIADGGVTLGMGFQQQAQTVYAPRIRAALKGAPHE